MTKSPEAPAHVTGTGRIQGISSMEPSSEPPSPTDSRGRQLPARTMADVARLFMEGARPLPQRTPPARQASPTEGAKNESDLPQSLPASIAATISANAILGLAPAGCDSEAWKLLLQAAQGLAAEQSTTVALVGLFSNGNTTSFCDRCGGRGLRGRTSGGSRAP